MVLNSLCFFIVLCPLVYLTVISIESLLYLTQILSLGLVVTFVSWQLTLMIKSRVLPFVTTNKKAVIITGCDTGFGNSIAKELFLEGFSVYACCLDPESDSSQSLARISKNLSGNSSGKIILLKVDVTNQDQVNQAVQLIDESTTRHCEQVYCLINNAGMILGGEIEWGTWEEIEKLFAINLMGNMRMTRSLLPLLRKSKLPSRIINMSSVAARFVTPGFVPYGVSKAAVSALSSGLRRELNKWNIRVIDIQPDLYKTSLLDRLIDGLERTWIRSPCNIRSSYGSEYFVCFKNYVRENLKTARPFPSEVVKTTCQAVLSSDPDDVYICCGRHNRLIIFLMDTLPDAILNFITSFFFPSHRPKGFDNITFQHQVNYHREHQNHVSAWNENKRHFIARGL